MHIRGSLVVDLDTLKGPEMLNANRISAVGALVGVFFLALTLLPTPPAQAAQPPLPTVGCLVDWDPPTGAHRTRPRSCELLQQGILGNYPIINTAVAHTYRLRWRHWGPKVATARGRLGISTAGLIHLNLRLTHPRTACGRTVFTRAVFTTWSRPEGRFQKNKGDMLIEDFCSD